MSTESDVIWLIDAPSVAHPIAQAIARDLGCVALGLQPAASLPRPGTLIIVEILLPKHSCGLTHAFTLKANLQHPVAVWTTSPSPLHTWVAWRIGLEGCLDKGQDWNQVLAHVTTLLEGQPVWPADIWQAIQTFEATVGHRFRRLKESDWDRWLDLLRCSSIKQLSSTWALSPRGTERAVTRLLETLCVERREEAVALARQAGLVRESTEGPRWSPVIALYRSWFTASQSLQQP